MDEGRLTDLYSIDWASLHHAIGPAGNIPELLLDLASPEAGVRDTAIGELYGNLCHQGTVYEASAYAVPFLIALLGADVASDKLQILVLLASLATGTSYHDVHSWNPAKEDRQAVVAKELSWVAACKTAVAARTKIYEAFLLDRDHDIRAAAAYLLGCAAESPICNLRLLDEVFRSPANPESVRLTAMMAIGYLEPRIPEASDYLEAASVSASDRSCRVAAAMALAVPGREMPSAARELLLDVALDRGDLQAIYESLPWDSLDLEDLVFHAVKQIPGGREELLPRLIESADRMSSSEAWQLSYLILHLVFDEPLHRESSAADLSPLQLQAVTAIARIDRFGTDHLAMGSFGLPSRRADLQRFLGIAPVSGAAEPAAPPAAKSRPWWKLW